ncbi:MAG TPA: DegT/DnrJ/EryC1/StrS family aminotransferase [Verrucomicrobiae bacterium]|nr:DegT/DnrJ/EryC1/StrS family aminotransferase [Verrucomicrobiae bacterium]
MTTIPFADLQAQHKPLHADLNAAIAEVLKNCDFILGRAVDAFEKEFAQFTGAQHAVGVGSGLDALRLCLQASGIGAGDEVIVPANTFIATALAVSAVGARPVLVDVEEATFNIDPARIESAIGPRTRAIIPVHLYGQAAEMDPIMAIAQRHKLVVIEDACQSHGAQYKGRTTGTFGLAGCFSFYPAKNLGACGDGGMIITNDESFAARLRLLRNYGQKQKYVHLEKGGNTRLDTVQAAILRVKLKHLADWNASRARHAQRYAEVLAGVPAITTPRVAPHRTHVFHLYVVRHPNRSGLQEFLAQRGVQTGIHYPVPIHRHAAYADLQYPQGSFPVSEQLSEEILSLPMFAELTDTQIDAVCDGVRAFSHVCQ